jgi:cell division protein FtsZ
VAAEIAKEQGAVVIAVVTMPFAFEMTRRAKNAVEGIKLLQPHTHTLITIPNDRLLAAVPKEASLEVAFRFADDVLRQGIQGIVELVTRPGLINVDFAHVRTLMHKGGGAFMAIGLGEGPDKARRAIYQALHHPMLEVESLEQASGALVHFTGGERLSLVEVGEAVQELRQALPAEADLIFGASTEPAMEGRAQVILILTGMGGRPVRATTLPDSQPAFSDIAGPPRLDSTDLDIPAFLRRRPARPVSPVAVATQPVAARAQQEQAP